MTGKVAGKEEEVLLPFEKFLRCALGNDLMDGIMDLHFIRKEIESPLKAKKMKKGVGFNSRHIKEFAA